jgi:AcrR family transcriptional regulator
MRSNTNESPDTKQKIMEVAFELFGRYGFEGTSIRQIALESEVNIAAVNYHFGSKENLFWDIMVETHKQLDEEIAEYFKSSSTLTELSIKTFKYFLNESLSLKNTIKLMLTESVSYIEDPAKIEIFVNPMGPPGGQFFAEAIQREIPYTLSREGLLWGVKSVFGSLFHWAFMCCTNQCGDNSLDKDPLFATDQIEKDVVMMIEASMLYLKNNKTKFEA